MAKIVIAQLDIDIKGLLKAASESKMAIAALKNELMQLQNTGEASSAQFKRNEEDMLRLTQAFNIQVTALKEHIKKSEEAAEGQRKVAGQINKTAGAQQELNETLAEAVTFIEGLKTSANEAGNALSGLNGSLQQNVSLLEQGANSASKQVKTFNDYKEQVKDSFDSINIFNGGLGGFISRAEEAGGAGPLIISAFNGMAQGIGGMTKSAMAFMATPIGAAITVIAAVLSPLIDYLKNTQEGIDKVTAVVRPLQSVFHALSGVFQNVGKFLSEAFLNPKEAIADFANMVKENIINRFEGLLELVPALGKAVGLLFEGEFSAAGKVAADAMGKVALGTENITDKVAGAASEIGKFLTEAYNKGVRIDELQKSLDKGLADYTKRTSELKTEMAGQNKIADDTNRSFAEREAAAIKAVETAKEQSRLMVQRLTQEIELLKLKQAQNGYTDAEKAELAELVAKRNEAAAQGVETERSQADKVNAIRNEAAAKAAELRKKAVDDALEKQSRELDLFIAKGSQQAKTQKEELAFEQEVSQKRMELFKAELNAKKISKAEYDKHVIDEANSLAQKVTGINVQHGKAALDLALKQSRSKLEGEKVLTEDLIIQENTRLKYSKDRKLEQLALEKDVNSKIVLEKYNTNQELSVREKEYMSQKLEAEEEYRQQSEANEEAFKTQVEQREAEEKAAKKMVQITEAETEYEEKLIAEDTRHSDEMARLDQMLADEKISKDQYTALERDEAEKTAAIKQQLAIRNAQTQLGTMQNIANALGEAFGQSKELAIAQATMNAGQAILSIWSGQISGNPVIDTAIKIALTATTAISTAKQIQKIQSAKKPKQPKFEKGGLVSIGGNRHSAGGTIFRGEDGTTFEAEQGELIGVMNRNAAHHFMAFNNAFPSGSASVPNYFAGGGIVSREITPAGIDIEMLAAKIADANRAIPAPVVAVQDIINEGNSYVKVRDGANF